MLIMDSFWGHLIQEIGEACIATNSLRAVIPGELTSQLQPLDLTVNRSIKCKIKNYAHRQNILSTYNRDHNRSEMLKDSNKIRNHRIAHHVLCNDHINKPVTWQTGPFTLKQWCILRFIGKFVWILINFFLLLKFYSRQY